MYALSDMGVLIGTKKFFQDGAPDYKRGGGTVQIVTQEEVFWEDPPQKEEAGTPNIMGLLPY